MELGNYLENLKSKKKSKPNSERAYWIELTAQKLGIPFEKVLWKTINWKTSWVKDMYLYCEHQGNFGKVWWGMIKKSKE